MDLFGNRIKAQSKVLEKLIEHEFHQLTLILIHDLVCEINYTNLSVQIREIRVSF
jgi:hypothetical protein